MERVAKTAYFLFILAVVGYLTRYGLNVFLARHLSPILYGDFSIAIKVLHILVTVTLFGTNIGAKRFLSKYLDLDKKFTAAHYIAWNLKLVSVSFIVVFIVATIAFILMIILHYYGVKDINHYRLAVYMLWLAPFGAAASLLQSFLLCTHRIFSPTILAEVFRYAIQLVFFILIALVFAHPLTNINIVMVLLISSVVVSVLAALIINKEIKFMLKLGFQHLSYTHVFHTKWLQTSIRMISNNIVFQLVCVSDLFIVQLFAQNPLHVGHYAAVLTIIAVMWLIPSNIYQGIKPQISGLITSSKGKAQLQQMLDKTNRVAMLAIITLGVLIIYFSGDLLDHFGPTYHSAKLALILMTIGTCIGAGWRIASMLLVFTDHEDFVLNMTIIELIFIFILVIPATYFFEITGTAAATALIMTIKPLICSYYVRKKLGLRATIFY